MKVRKINLYSLLILALMPILVLWLFITDHRTDWSFVFGVLILHLLHGG
jgi:hypothetical protein